MSTLPDPTRWRIRRVAKEADLFEPAYWSCYQGWVGADEPHQTFSTAEWALVELTPEQVWEVVT